MEKLEFILQTNSALYTVNKIDFKDGSYTMMDGYYPDVSGAERDTDKFDLMIQGASAADLMEKIKNIELLLTYAANHPTGPEAVWAHYTPDFPAITAKRSRITGGAVLYTGQMLTGWKEFKMAVEVVFERMPWWETIDEEDLPLRNGNYPRIDAWNRPYGLVLNHTDSYDDHLVNAENISSQSYLYILPSDLKGGLPAPAKILLQNNVSNSWLIDNLFIGHFCRGFLADNVSLDFVLQGSGIADPACSGGSYETLNWVGTGETMIKDFSLNTITEQHYYKFIMRLQSVFAYTDLYFKLKLFNGNIQVAETPWALGKANKSLQVLGSMRLPPHYGNSAFLRSDYFDQQHVKIYVKRAGGSGSINLDFLDMLPMDSFRHFRSVSSAGISTNILIDDPYEGTLFNWGPAGEGAVTHVIESGNPIMIQPGLINTLCFLHDRTDGTAPIIDLKQIYIIYHPRWRGI